MTDLGHREVMVLGIVLASVMLLVLIVDAVLFALWLLRRDDELAGRKPPLFARTWSLVDPWVGAQIGLGVLVFVLMAASLVYAVLGRGALMSRPGAPEAMVFIVLTLIVQNALLVAVPVAYVTLRYRLDLRSIGFAWLPTRAQVAAGVGGGVAVLLLGRATELGLSFGLGRLLAPEVAEMLERISRAMSVAAIFPDVSTSWSQFAALFVGAAIAAPIGEEFFFRGLLHNCARRRMGVVWGTLLSSAVFALVHGGPIMVVAILPMGMLLAWAYDRTGSLWVPIIMHAVNNGVLALAMRFAPGLAQ